MKIAAIDDTPQSAAALQTTLKQASLDVPLALSRVEALKHSFAALDIELILLHSKTPDHRLLDALARISMERACPLAVFTEDRDGEKIRYAMQLGVAAYVIDGFSVGRMRAVLDVAITRFHELQLLYRKLEKAEKELLERKIVERAKGLVMKRRSCDEQTAYRAIQKAAMDSNLRMVEVARQVLNVSDLMRS